MLSTRDPGHADVCGWGPKSGQSICCFPERALGSLVGLRWDSGAWWAPHVDPAVTLACLLSVLRWGWDGPPRGSSGEHSETAWAVVCFVTRHSCALSASLGHPGLVFSSVKEDVPSVLGLFQVIRSGSGLGSHRYPLRSSAPHCPEGTGCLQQEPVCPRFWGGSFSSAAAGLWPGPVRDLRTSCLSLPVSLSKEARLWRSPLRLLPIPPAPHAQGLRVPGRPWCEQQSPQTYSYPGSEGQ